ncbi:serine/threonine protein kinase [bacterium]|nr:serine/threonine protein kinase [bacterium]
MKRGKYKELIGHVLGDRYEITSFLGAGANGVAYEAIDTSVGSSVALKLLSSEVTQDPIARKRLEREIENAFRVKNDYTAQLYSLFVQEPYIGLVLELVPGHTLYDHLVGGVRFGVREVANFGRQIAAGLHDIHSHGIIHRDLKLENVKLTPDGRVKILDFGASVLLEQLQEEGHFGGIQDLSEFAYVRVTRTGHLVGTLLYLCPEYMKTGVFDRRVDVYALGIMLYELIAGRPPYQYDTARELMRQKMRGSISPPSELAPHCSARLDSLILQMTSVDPDLRPSSLEEVITILSEESQRLPLSSRQQAPPGHDFGRAASVRYARGISLLTDVLVRLLPKYRVVSYAPKRSTRFFGRAIDAIFGLELVRQLIILAFLVFLGMLIFSGKSRSGIQEHFIEPIQNSQVVREIQRYIYKFRYITPNSEKSKSEVIRGPDSS